LNNNFYYPGDTTYIQEDTFDYTDDLTNFWGDDLCILVDTAVFKILILKLEKCVLPLRIIYIYRVLDLNVLVQQQIMENSMSQ
jgi:hypothetical protein